jgi:hypothetical protein
MANEERLKGPNTPRPPDTADEVQRRTVAPTPQQPPAPREAMRDIDRASAKDMAREAEEGHAEALFPPAEITRLRAQWTEIQATFVDEPRNAVKSADSLVGDVLKSLSETFSSERSRLEGQWDREGDITTEDFRVALRRYRTFFDRLLSL